MTITGSNFVNGATVTIGGNSAAPVTFVNAGTLTVQTPPGLTGPRNVVVTNPDAQSGNLAGGFTYLAPAATAAPGVTSITPGTGPVAGGTTVTLTGSNFQSGAAVIIGGKSSIITLFSANSITAVTPVGAAGARDVEVQNPDFQASVLAGAFTYAAPGGPVSPPPVIGGGGGSSSSSSSSAATGGGGGGSTAAVLELRPAVGPTAGGTRALILGYGFWGATGATVGGKPGHQRRAPATWRPWPQQR
ncbi:MAG: IPT/TIG domain-containing protein [Actinobacteria bacterium]|nr:IPT/TIG domain-containing protein [Actinomycetota bacterium]